MLLVPPGYFILLQPAVNVSRLTASLCCSCAIVADMCLPSSRGSLVTVVVACGDPLSETLADRLAVNANHAHTVHDLCAGTDV